MGLYDYVHGSLLVQCNYDFRVCEVKSDHHLLFSLQDSLEDT